MDIKQLRYFSAIYERRNLSHAAQQCCVAQSAISHHLSRLEQELGARLFERQARGMEPTPAGSRLYEHAQTILRGMAAAATDVQQMSDVIRGELNIGLPHTVIDAIAVPLLEELGRTLPEAQVIIHEAFSSELYRQLIAGEHDLIFCYNMPQDERLKLMLVHSEHLCCVGLPAQVGADPAPIPMADVLKLPHIVARRGYHARSISDQARFTQGLQNQARFELQSFNGSLRAIRAGLAVMVCPQITVRDQVRTGELVARPIVDPISTRSLFMARQSDRLPTRLMDAVSTIVMDLIGQETASGAWPIVGQDEGDPST